VENSAYEVGQSIAAFRAVVGILPTFAPGCSILYESVVDMSNKTAVPIPLVIFLILGTARGARLGSWCHRSGIDLGRLLRGIGPEKCATLLHLEYQLPIISVSLTKNHDHYLVVRTTCCFFGSRLYSGETTH